MATPSRPEPSVIQGDATLNSLPPSLTGAGQFSCPLKTGDFPQVIPPVERHTGRNLILCFDGTGDQYDNDNSNIVRFFQLLKKDDRSKQMVYYQAGIGTGINSKGSTNSFINKISDAIDGAIATGLGAHVRGGYEFLMQNYTEGDRISMFGFSRGAYTARALAGMLHKVGLLPAYNHEQVKFAYHMFKRDDEEGWKMSNGFKRAFSIDVKIDFLGVFDTVNSVGIIPRELPFAKSNYLIRVFRHAVALDERRAKFKANLWGRATQIEEKLGDAGKRAKYHKPHREASLGTVWEIISGGDSEKDRGRTKKNANPGSALHRNGHDFASPEDRKHQTDVKEVWFAGAHCDVGGGSVRNETPHDLARIPLRWMIRECFLNNTGILFHSSELNELGLCPTTLWPTVKIPTPPDLNLDDDKDSGHHDGHALEVTDATAVNIPLPPPDKLVPDEKIRLGSAEDEKDAVQPIYDQLSIKRGWWVLEVLPMRQRYQRHDGTWRAWFSVNMGGPRVIHGQKRFPTYVHRSVLYRMQQLGYIPRAELLQEPGPIWID
ncbi:choline transport protein [Ceratobasidium sp. AG-Ba]|nr:choline transport protein [Ceratobasidium sp. AG-Ba]QRW07924.1 choline transport protein [Ceratobasidium sp. AG-Ba]